MTSFLTSLSAVATQFLPAVSGQRKSHSWPGFGGAGDIPLSNAKNDNESLLISGLVSGMEVRTAMIVTP